MRRLPPLIVPAKPVAEDVDPDHEGEGNDEAHLNKRIAAKPLNREPLTINTITCIGGMVAMSAVALACHLLDRLLDEEKEKRSEKDA